MMKKLISLLVLMLTFAAVQAFSPTTSPPDDLGYEQCVQTDATQTDVFTLEAVEVPPVTYTTRLKVETFQFEDFSPLSAVGNRLLAYKPPNAKGIGLIEKELLRGNNDRNIAYRHTTNVKEGLPRITPGSMLAQPIRV